MKKIIKTEVNKDGEKRLVLDLDELSTQPEEVFFCEDSSRGIKIELRSKRLDIERLSNLGLGTFDWLQKQRTENKLVMGAG